MNFLMTTSNMNVMNKNKIPKNFATINTTNATKTINGQYTVYTWLSGIGTFVISGSSIQNF